MYSQHKIWHIAKKITAQLTQLQKKYIQHAQSLRKEGLSFGDYFKDERTYIHIGKKQFPDLNAPQVINDLLNKAEYSIVDYRKGIAQKFDKRLNKFTKKSIGKVLNESIQDKKVKDVAMKMFNERLQGNIKNPQKIDFYCVITHKAQDVGAMSTDRNWQSCMKLPNGNGDLWGGEYYYTALRQVTYGGMCAYLIDADDMNIERPYSRIAIKRLENKIGDFIYKSQNRTYEGVYVSDEIGFKEIVKKELQKSNRLTENNGGYFETADPISYSDNDIHHQYIIKNKNSLLSLTEKQFIDYCKSDERNIEQIMYYLDNKKYIDKHKIINELLYNLPEYYIFYHNKTKCYHGKNNYFANDDFIIKYADYIDWIYLSCTQVLSEKILDKFKDRIYWKGVNSLRNEYDSLMLYKKFKDYLDIHYEYDDQFDATQYVEDTIYDLQPAYMDGSDIEDISEDGKTIIKWSDFCNASWLLTTDYSNLSKYPSIYKALKSFEFRKAKEYIEKNDLYSHMSNDEFLQKIYGFDEDSIQDWEDFLNNSDNNIFISLIIEVQQQFRNIPSLYKINIRTNIEYNDYNNYYHNTDQDLYENNVVIEGTNQFKEAIKSLIKEGFNSFPSF